MFKAYKTLKFDVNDRIIASENAKGYCVFCHKLITAQRVGKYYCFECGCKGEREYLRST